MYTTRRPLHYNRPPTTAHNTPVAARAFPLSYLTHCSLFLPKNCSLPNPTTAALQSTVYTRPTIQRNPAYRRRLNLLKGLDNSINIIFIIIFTYHSLLTTYHLPLTVFIRIPNETHYPPDWLRPYPTAPPSVNSYPNTLVRVGL